MKKKCKKYDKNSFSNKLKTRLDEYQKETKALLDVQYGVFEPKILYHYSPIKSIKNIIELRQIWYTHYKDLGVRSEFKLPYEMSKEVIKEVAEKSRNVDFWNRFIKVFCEANFLERFAVYTLSLSTEQDNSYLWDTFVDPDETGLINGCAIGFEPNFSITQEISVANNRSEGLLIIMSPINYDKEKFNDHIREFASCAERKLNMTLSEDYIKLSSQLSLKFQQDLISYLISNVLSLLSVFIESKHRKEKEIRRFIMEFHDRRYLLSTQNTRKS
jgi:hypothetical protein